PVLPLQKMSGRQFPDVLEYRAVARRIEEREVVIERLEIEPLIHGASGEQRFDFAAEVQPAIAFDVMQRLDPGAIPREQERPPRFVPDAEANPWLDVHAFVVRATVPDDRAHAVDEREFRIEPRRGRRITFARR